MADTPGFGHGRRALVKPRDLKKGGVAGVAVGCVVAVVLLCVCLYPFIIRRIQSKRRKSSGSHDAETAHVPTTETPFSDGIGERGSHKRQSSRDSSSNKDSQPTEVGSKKALKLDIPADGGRGYTHPQQQERGDSVTHGNITPRNQPLSKGRLSGSSHGRHPKWNTEGPPPLSPEGIELSTTRADGLDYNEAMAGQSASYYSEAVPPEALGMVTPPEKDQAHFPERKRSGSRGSSLKFSLMSLMRRMSSKDTHKNSPSPTQESSGGQRAAGGTSRFLRDELTESPVTHQGPSFHDFGHPAQHTSQFTAPARLPISPESTPEPTSQHDESTRGATGQSAQPTTPDPILPPSSPAPGTVNPMDIMAPSNHSEHVWHANQELYYIANPHSSPPRKSAQSDQQQEGSSSPPHYSIASKPPAEQLAPISPSPEVSQEPTFQPAAQPYSQPASHPISRPASNHSASQSVSDQYQHPTQYPQAHLGDHLNVPDTAVQYDFNHLTPGHARNSSITTSSVDGTWTERSDRSTPFPSHGSSVPSHHNTPNTQLTEISPSPRSDLGSDIRNSASPYVVPNSSPQLYMCDECPRGFDQIHKLNHHRRYHERPHECPHKNCDKRFGTKTHLDRHINDKHNKIRKFHCLEPTCPYSKAGGKAFPRKDNWRRHMINKHGMSPSADPEPDVADEHMTGT